MSSMGTNKFALIGAFSGFVEMYQESQTAPDAAEAVDFDIIVPSKVRGEIQQDDGWIDIRGFVRATIVVESSTQDTDYVVYSRQTTHDSRTTELVSSTTVSAGSASTLYESDCEHLAWIKLDHVATSSGSNGTTMAEIMLK